jgi:hypothetical protein
MQPSPTLQENSPNHRSLKKHGWLPQKIIPLLDRQMQYQ